MLGFGSEPLDAPAIFQVPPEGYSLKEAKVRLARAQERVRWDQTVDQHHYLGFKRFAGRGLRYIVEWRGQWLALAGWQSGAFVVLRGPSWISFFGLCG